MKLTRRELFQTVAAVGATAAAAGYAQTLVEPDPIRIGCIMPGPGAILGRPVQVYLGTDREAMRQVFQGIVVRTVINPEKLTTTMTLKASDGRTTTMTFSGLHD